MSGGVCGAIGLRAADELGESRAEAVCSCAAAILFECAADGEFWRHEAWKLTQEYFRKVRQGIFTDRERQSLCHPRA